MKRILVTAALAAMLVASMAVAQQGMGGGKGRGDGSGDGGGCATLKLFDGDTLVWSRDAKEFETDAAIEQVAGRPALPVAALLAGVDDARRLEIAACGGRAFELRRHEFTAPERKFYVAVNRRGAYKFVEIDENGREQILVRNVGRITIIRRESASPRSDRPAQR